jgi:hypothetical protein
VIDFVLYCKSYSTDLKRLLRLARSVEQYNRERIPFHVSVPESEFALFKEHLAGINVVLHRDEDILRARSIDLMRVSRLPGAISQQIVKSSFWSLGISNIYLCLDSDAFFLRPFGVTDFVHPTGTPYTVLDEAHELLEDAIKHRKTRVVSAFLEEARRFQTMFERSGRAYSFGPFPLVWHKAVWQSLDADYLAPRGMNFVDAIEKAPIESRWYGEALLKYRAIELYPVQALFKVFHYAWQADQNARMADNLKQLVPIYCGAIYQSAWEREMDWPAEGGSIFSRLGRRIRRRLGRT